MTMGLGGWLFIDNSKPKPKKGFKYYLLTGGEEEEDVPLGAWGNVKYPVRAYLKDETEGDRNAVLWGLGEEEQIFKGGSLAGIRWELGSDAEGETKPPGWKWELGEGEVDQDEAVEYFRWRIRHRSKVQAFTNKHPLLIEGAASAYLLWRFIAK